MSSFCPSVTLCIVFSWSLREIKSRTDPTVVFLQQPTTLMLLRATVAIYVQLQRLLLSCMVLQRLARIMVQHLIRQFRMTGVTTVIDISLLRCNFYSCFTFPQLSTNFLQSRRVLSGFCAFVHRHVAQNSEVSNWMWKSLSSGVTLQNYINAPSSPRYLFQCINSVFLYLSRGSLRFTIVFCCVIILTAFITDNVRLVGLHVVNKSWKVDSWELGPQIAWFHGVTAMHNGQFRGGFCVDISASLCRRCSGGDRGV